MVAAIVTGVVMITTIDVQISLSQIDQSDSTTWPNTAPQIRYYFIPIFSALVALGAVAFNWIVQLVSRRQVARPLHWALLGFAFSLVSIAFPLARVGVDGMVAIVLSLTAALFAILFVWWRFSVPYVRPAV